VNDGNSAAGFAAPHWSIVLSAGAVESPQVRSALESLCRPYSYPLYAFIRRRGYPQEDVRDLVQSFFAHILTSDFRAHARDDKERFRSYVFDALNYLLADSGGPREGVL
jgi:RNA polymerase sigma-70 factor (ECF subfamily)